MSGLDDTHSVGDGCQPPHTVPPRVWTYPAFEPADFPKVRDCHGDVWEYRADGLWWTPETKPFGWATVAKKWGPLTEVVEPAPVPPADPAATATELPRSPVDPGTATEDASGELNASAEIELKLWHLLDAAQTEWLASDEPCDRLSALVRALLDSGWRPPLPDAPKAEIAGFLSTIGLERSTSYRVAAWLLGGYHVTRRKVASSSPLPDSETEWGWRYVVDPEDVRVATNEAEARWRVSQRLILDSETETSTVVDFCAERGETP